MPPPKADPDGPFAMLAIMLECDPYLGRVLTGRIHRGTASAQHGGQVARRATACVIEEGRLTKLLAFRGLERVPIEGAEAGDIIAIAGLGKTTVADTLCAPEVTRALAGAADRSADHRHDLLGQ